MKPDGFLAIGQTYTLNGEDVYRVTETPRGQIFLKNLNRSAVWKKLNSGIRQGYAEGFLVDGRTLDPFGYEIDGGELIDWKDTTWGCAGKSGFLVDDLKPCGVKAVVVDMGEWSLTSG